MPITIKLQCFGNEIELFQYTNFKVKELVAQATSLSGLDDPQTLKLKVVEETRTRRIDTQMYLKETLTLPEELRVLNSLHDMKVAHNAIIMVE